ncbi:hypothetical protein GGR51DRAFT_555542 [Nemania sp. FL0031]|nr:hypothetical protein GGR51DRAFT_555542 [Nemania sp. FL0031]
MASSTDSTSVSANDGRHSYRAQPGETALAYLLKWTDTEVAKTSVHSSSQLQSCIRENSNYTRHLFVFHGLPVDHGVVLKEEVDIDTAFIEAHAGRRPYRPLKSVSTAWAHYDYPELVHQSAVPSDVQQKIPSHDLVGEPPTYVTSTTGDGVMFCRASLWLSDKAHILCLDRAGWENSKSGVARRYQAYTSEKIPDENGVATITMLVDADGNTTTLGDEIPNLETMLHSSLLDGCSNRADLIELLEELIINKWEDFFETLGLDLPIGSAEATAIFSQTLNCLERNLSISRRRHKIRHRSIETLPNTYPLPNTEWEVLLSRLDRRAQLLRHLSPVVASVEMPVRKPSVETDAEAIVQIPSVDSHNTRCGTNSGNNRDANRDSSTLDDNQRSLNRVTYLGGVLLPFSIVSGILSIQEPYGPGSSQFWIFWVVTVPLVLITLAIMYADSIRKAEVWVEDATSGRSDDSEPESELPGRVPTPDVEQAVPVSRFAQPIFFSPVPEAAVVQNEQVNGDRGEPDTMVERRHWRNDDAESGPDKAAWARKKKWRKEQLGWMGAFATLFRVYTMKKGIPPRHLRHNQR